MGLFAKTKKNPGWMAITPRLDGVYLAHVTRPSGGPPVVEAAAFYSSEGAAVPDLLQRAAREIHADRYQCTTLLGSGEYQILSVDAPNVPPEELKTAIRWRLKDMLDFHIDDATIDVVDIPVEKNAPSRSHFMYAVAARNQVVQQRQAMFGQARIPLSVIDIAEMGQRNFSVLLQPERRGLAMLSFDEQGGLLTIAYSGELYLSRRMDITLPQLRQAPEDQRNVLFDRITLELQRSLDHFERQYQFIAVSKLVLAPLGEIGTGLQSYLSSNLYIPIEVMDLEAVLDLSKVPELKAPDAKQRFFLSLGAALRHEEKVL